MAQKPIPYEAKMITEFRVLLEMVFGAQEGGAHKKSRGCFLFVFKKACMSWKELKEVPGTKTSISSDGCAGR